MFILGFIMMAVGLLAVWKTDFFLRNFGDISEIFGATNASWISWKVVGTALIVLGFLIAFSLIQLFFQLTFGRLFNLGQL